MAKRTGVFSLQKWSKKVCQLLTKYSTLIKVTWPAEVALHAALDAAALACAVLVTELEGVREYGD